MTTYEDLYSIDKWRADSIREFAKAKEIEFQARADAADLLALKATDVEDGKFLAIRAEVWREAARLVGVTP